MGLILGLVGLAIFTWVFVYTASSPSIAFRDRPDQLWLLAAWAVYPLLVFLFYYTNPKLSLIFGLIFLLFPPIYIASYDSVLGFEIEVVGAQRVFGPSTSPSVTLTINLAIFSAPLASLPVAISDMTLEFLVSNSSIRPCLPYHSCDYEPYLSVGVSNLQGGTLFPYGHLDYQLKFTSSDYRLVRSVNETWTHFELKADSHPVSVSSLLYSQTYSPDYPSFRVLWGRACWDWRTGQDNRTLSYNYMC
jgi:hypothetical protein